LSKNEPRVVIKSFLYNKKVYIIKFINSNFMLIYDHTVPYPNTVARLLMVYFLAVLKYRSLACLFFINFNSGLLDTHFLMVQ